MALELPLELLLRARHCLALGRFDEAESLARRAEKSDAANALHVLGLVSLRRGRPDAAEAALRKAISRDDGIAAYHNDLGNALQDRGRLSEAIACYRRALRLHPEFAEAWNDLGTARYAKGDLDAAVACYRQALRLRPDHVVAYANLGAVYRKLGLLGEARRALQRELAQRLRQALRALGGRLVRFGAAARLDLGSAQALGALARTELQGGNFAHALAIAELALRVAPRDAPALRVMSAARLRLGRHAEAVEAARLARDAQPRDPESQRELGRALLASGRAEEAIAAFEEALRLQPRSGEVLAAMGELRLRQGDAPAAEALLRRALSLRPQDAGLHVSLGEARHRQGGLADAESAYRKAIALEPMHFAAHIRLSELLRDSDRLDEAEAAARMALEIDPESAAAHLTLGLAHKVRWQLKQARQFLERALELSPHHVQAMQQLALVLRELDEMPEAERLLRAAVRAKPTELAFLVDLGMILADQMRYPEAMELFDRALAIDPRHVVAINRKALLVDHLGDPVRGLELLHQALALSPEDDFARYNVGLQHLKHGDYARGWEGYERRRSFDTFVGRYRRLPLPEWDGGPLDGKVLLVLPEQGLGDEIMFGSCLPDVAARARHVIVECDRKLEAIFRRSFPGCTVVSRQRTRANDWISRIEPKPDLQVAAGSLAGLFRRRAEDFPQRPFLKADTASMTAWKTRLDSLGPGRKIGLSWRGGVGFTGRTRRSFTLDALLPVLRLPGLHFVNLQYTDATEEMRSLYKAHGVRLHHWQEAIDDYDQTAALVAVLDGVLTVCTAIVHLTGSQGQRGLVMVPFGADWRYGATGERMIWYPSLRLLRQRRVGDWREVLDDVSRRLAADDWQ